VAGALARGHPRRPREEISPIVARSEQRTDPDFMDVRESFTE
jgi:hypothetical protein